MYHDWGFCLFVKELGPHWLQAVWSIQSGKLTEQHFLKGGTATYSSPITSTGQPGGLARTVTVKEGLGPRVSQAARLLWC